MHLQLLKKSLEHLVDRHGPLYGRTRLLKLVFLADRAWHQSHRSAYTEAEYYRWNHGPFAKEVLTALEWLDGVEVVETAEEYPGGTRYRYGSGRSTRLRGVSLDSEFVSELDNVAARWGKEPLPRLLDHVYALPDFKAAAFGERLLRPSA